MYTLNNLPPKFQPFLIGSPTCCVNKSEIDEIFQKPLKILKNDYVFTSKKWILKLERADKLITTKDTHLYRVRKAEKIRAFIKNNNLEAHIVVPKKYLYWNKNENQFYVVAEKIDLSKEVAKPAPGISYEGNEGQARALNNGAKQRSLTTIQAKALAELSFLGYTDLSYNNLFFTHTGKVAIIDTEPLKRFIKKNNKHIFYPFDKGALLTKQSIAGISKLKQYTDDPIALEEVKKVEKNHVIWRIAKLIAKNSIITATTLSFYFFPIKSSKIKDVNIKILKVFLIEIAIIKNLFLTLDIYHVLKIWDYSLNEDYENIRNLEVEGII